MGAKRRAKRTRKVKHWQYQTGGVVPVNPVILQGHRIVRIPKPVAVKHV